MTTRSTPTLPFILRDFWRFLRAPAARAACLAFFGRATPGRVVLLLFLVGLFLHGLTALIEAIGFRPIVRAVMGEELGRQTYTYYGTADRLIGSLVSAPLFEELAYRWGLRFHPVRTAVSLGLIAFYWLPFGGTYSMRIVEVVGQPGFYLMLGSALLVGLTAYALLRIPFVGRTVAEWWERRFAVVYYISSLLFGFMHLFNVQNLTVAAVGLVGFITFQQIAFGFFNGYVRMRFGFIQAVLQHALFNLVPVAVALSS